MYPKGPSTSIVCTFGAQIATVNVLGPFGYTNPGSCAGMVVNCVHSSGLGLEALIMPWASRVAQRLLRSDGWDFCMNVPLRAGTFGNMRPMETESNSCS